MPERYGHAPEDLQRIREALDAARGDAYDTSSDTSNVRIENHAIARAIYEVWETNRRLSFMWDPLRMPESALVRWEKICRLYPLATDTVVARRARLATHFERFGQKPTYQRIYDALDAAMGDVFVNVFHITIAESVSQWPGGSPPDANNFNSTVARVLVKTQKPSSYTLGQFLEAVNGVHRVLDGIMPAHMTYDWYLNGPGHTGVWATDTGAGFFLDDENNLDCQIFDV